MRKYLREIEISGVFLAAIGIVCALVWGTPYGMWPCGLGLLLLLVIFLYKAFCAQLSAAIGNPVQTGEFGADMKVELLNDGPVTICMDTKNKE